MAAIPEMLKVALEVRPTSVTLVPERREELTTEGGLDVRANAPSLGDAVRVLGEAGIRTTLFVDPDLEQIKSAHRVGAAAVEIHTGRYAEAGPGAPAELTKISDAVKLAAKLRLEVGVGHGLDYSNVGPLVPLAEIEEFSIGHSIVARAVLVGLERAVAEMKALVG
jgi:pyridoxine 5-phosphate synthase